MNIDPKELAQFMTTICTIPADDFPRLVLADRLEEVGDASLAEFIRIQIELASIKMKGPDIGSIRYATSDDVGWAEYHNEDPHVNRLRKRELELLKAERQTWLTPLVEIFGHNCPPEASGLIGWRAEFHRGFISTLITTLRSWRGGQCPRCSGYRHQTVFRDDERQKTTTQTCGNCGGTGVIAGLGPSIVACVPITRISFSGIHPSNTRRNSGGSRCYAWFADRDTGAARLRFRPDERQQAAVIPHEWLAGKRRKNFATEALAQAWLSLTAINEARDKADLPLLEPLQCK